jgi:hypothetical protein
MHAQLAAQAAFDNGAREVMKASTAASNSKAALARKLMR